MALFKCKMCGGDLEIAEGVTVAECEYCGTKQTVPRDMDDNLQNLFNRANILRIKSEFDKAEKMYEKIIQADPAQSEAYWGLILCKYGIEYVDDPATFKKIPTCHRASYDSIIADDDYKLAIKHADISQRVIYEEQAKEIDRIQKDILSLAQKEENYDVFICYKETDTNGGRTQDSVIANDIYYQLKQEGFKVFYAAITLEGKLGSAYEPIIFAALNSAKVMLAIGTKPEYFNAVWVKNEWSRYLKNIKQDRSKLLIPCYRDMDPYELPEEFAHLQAQDMSKIGFVNDIIRGIKKVVKKDEQKSTVSKDNIVTSTNINVTIAPLLKRAFMFIEDGEWSSADEYCERVLDQDPENAQAYLGKLLVDLKCRKKETIVNQDKEPASSKSFNKFIKFADEKLATEIKEINLLIKERNAQKAAEERRKAAEERRKAEEERRRAEEEKRKVEEEKRKIEEERRKAAEERQRLIEEERRKAEEERRKAAEERRKVEEEKRKAEEERQRLIEEERRKIEEERRKAEEERRRAEEERRRKKRRTEKIIKITVISVISIVSVALIGSFVGWVIANNNPTQEQIDNGYCTPGVNINESGVVTSFGFIPSLFFKNVYIPSEYNGKPVTAIKDKAFRETLVNNVTIADGITEIGKYAFYLCYTLESVSIPNSVTSIGESAFGSSPIKTLYIDAKYIPDYLFKNKSLTTVVIGDGVEKIGVEAFAECDNLTSVTMGNGIINIGSGAFAECNKLLFNEFDNACYLGNEDNPYVALIKAKTKDITSCEINDNTKAIAAKAFQGCTGFKKIVIPNGVKGIGKQAFDHREIESIYIPKSVSFMSGWAIFSHYTESGMIYCEANSQPQGWEKDFMYGYKNIVWGYTGD